MELDDNLPDRVVEMFEEETPPSVDVRTTPTTSESLCLHEVEDEFGSIEFTRGLGQRVIEETGYTITGIREHPDRGYIEVWFDPIDGQTSTEHLTVAQRAARVLSESSSATLKPNISDDPKEQYVDVYPDPHEQASEDYSLREETLERLWKEGIVLRSFSGGRERSEWNDENYRLWFKVTE